MEANNYEPSSSSLGSMMGLVVKNKARAKNIKKNIFAHQTRRYYIGRTRRCQCRHKKESVMFFHQLNDRTAGGGRKEALIAYCRRGYVQILLELHLHWYCMCVFLLLLFAYEILVGIDARRPFWPAFFSAFHINDRNIYCYLLRFRAMFPVAQSNCEAIRSANGEITNDIGQNDFHLWMASRFQIDLYYESRHSEHTGRWIWSAAHRTTKILQTKIAFRIMKWIVQM